MNLVLKLLLVAAFLWLGYALFGEAQAMREMSPDNPEYDPTRIVVYFLLIIVLAIAVGLLVAVTILPDLGDRFGRLFYDSGERVEKDPHAEAVALVNSGDYIAAVHAYQRIVSRNPDDMHALSEAVRILCEKLEMYDDAVEYLEGFLDEEMPAERTAFLAERLVDVHWECRQDADAAIPILDELMRQLPDTKYSANAFHRKNDILRAVGRPVQHVEIEGEAGGGDTTGEEVAGEGTSDGGGGGADAGGPEDSPRAG